MHRIDAIMSVPKVNSCCGCVSLTTGSIIIGYLYTILAAFELCVYALVVSLRPLEDNDTQAKSTVVYAYYIGGSVISVLQMVFGTLLIVGATRRKPYLMLPWTISVGVSAALYAMLAVTGCSLLLQYDTLDDKTVIVFIHFIKACISIYCIIVVHSLHKEIMDKNFLRARYRVVTTIAEEPA